MSDLQRSAMEARIAKLPRNLPPISQDDHPSDEEDGLGSLLSTSSWRSSGSKTRPSRAKISSTLEHTPSPEFSPLSAANSFAQTIQVPVASSDLDFRVYYTPPAVSPSSRNNSISKDFGNVIVCHHGAGLSALGFACFAEAVTRSSQGECGVLAFDARGHGETTSLSNPGHDPNPKDFSLTTLSSDLTNFIATLFPDPSTSPSFVLLGHSMGGAVVVAASKALLKEKKYTIIGICMLDVAGGTAIQALPQMQNFLDSSRPKGFESVEKAIEWHVTSHTIRNSTSARMSVPPLVYFDPSAKLDKRWKWRTNLKETDDFWSGWFTGLSEKFLEASPGRLLVLASTETLDTTLTKGQVGGMFQMEILRDVGHSVHEDNPERLAEILVAFWRRHDRIIPGFKKVGEA